MKKYFWILSFFALSVLVLPLCAKAHPGRTDGSGGHTNRSTGEYHYHHGYPAHDHYDIDGDGDIDCPYDFKDNTEHRSGSAGAISNSEKKEEASFWGKLMSIVYAIGLSIIWGITITIMLLKLLDGIFGWDLSGSFILFTLIGISVVIFFALYPIT